MPPAALLVRDLRVTPSRENREAGGREKAVPARPPALSAGVVAQLPLCTLLP